MVDQVAVETDKQQLLVLAIRLALLHHKEIMVVSDLAQAAVAVVVELGQLDQQQQLQMVQMAETVLLHQLRELL
jgi:hypothetical protein